LHKLVESGASINNLIDTFKSHHNAIYMKSAQMGLKLVVVGKAPRKKERPTTTSTVLPKNILTHEQSIRILAITALKRPNLDNSEL